MTTEPILKRKILVIEDDQGVCDSICQVLNEHGFEAMSSYLGRKGYAMYRDEHPDVALIDGRLPDMDGFTVVRMIRETDWLTPIIFISGAFTKPEDICLGLSTGVNDYLTKPFTMMELEAHINRWKVCPSFHFGQCCYTPATQTLKVNDREHRLTRMQGVILSLLCQHIGEPVARKQFGKCLWNQDPVGSRAIDIHITDLRKLLKDDPSILISSRYATGYMLEVTGDVSGRFHAPQQPSRKLTFSTAMLRSWFGDRP